MKHHDVRLLETSIPNRSTVTRAVVLSHNVARVVHLNGSSCSPLVAALQKLLPESVQWTGSTRFLHTVDRFGYYQQFGECFFGTRKTGPLFIIYRIRLTMPVFTLTLQGPAASCPCWTRRRPPCTLITEPASSLATSKVCIESSSRGSTSCSLNVV